MKKEDKLIFMGLMEMLANVYDQEINEKKFLGYWMALEDYSIEQVKKAVSMHLKSSEKESTFFPKPADLIRRLEGTTGDKAQVAWSEAITMMRKYGAYSTIKFNDPKTADVIRRMGGWPHLCRMSLEEMPFREREFCRFYEAIKQSSNEQVLAGLHDINNLHAGHEAQELKQLETRKLIGE